MKKIPILFVLLFLISSCKNQVVENRNNNSKENATIVTTQKSKITNSAFEKENIFGIWTTDPNGPHADFELTENSFYLVDYDGDGDMSYEINDNKIKIKYPDFEKTGLIKKAENDSLIIYWESGEFTTYVRWKQ
ncbi:MAG: hypothetical protein ABIQ27_03400 [Flavobacterium sp.]|uniref:hypothetical protein n=1 Tax=Flavobacterium sp. TaxID=239 RepID=UPI003262EB11